MATYLADRVIVYDGQPGIEVRFDIASLGILLFTVFSGFMKHAIGLVADHSHGQIVRDGNLGICLHVPYFPLSGIA